MYTRNVMGLKTTAFRTAASFILIIFLLYPRSAFPNYQQGIYKDFAEKTKGREAMDFRRQFFVLAPTKERAEEVLAYAESLRQRFYNLLNCSRLWDNPAIIAVFKEKWELDKEMGGSGARAAAVTSRFGGKPYRIILCYDSKDLLKEEFAHELTHLLINDLADKSIRSRDASQSPSLALHEGMAQYMSLPEDVIRIYEKFNRYAAERDAFYDIEELLKPVEDYPVHDRFFFYVQSWSFIRFLIENKGGAQNIRNYITMFNTHVSDPLRAFCLAFKLNPNSLGALKNEWLMSTNSYQPLDLSIKTPPLSEPDPKKTDQDTFRLATAEQEIIFTVAQRLAGKGNTAAVKACINDLQTLGIHGPVPIYLEGYSKLHSGDIAGGLTTLEQAQNTLVKLPHVYTAMACGYMELKHYEKAVNILMTAPNNDQKDFQLLFAGLIAHVKIKDYSRAAQIYEIIVRQYRAKKSSYIASDLKYLAEQRRIPKKQFTKDFFKSTKELL